MLEVRESAPDHLTVVGTVDLVSGAGLRSALHEAIERAVSARVPVLEVDLHDVDFVDAAGLGILLGAHRRARRAGLRLRIVRPSPEFARVLLVSRLYRVLDVRSGDVVDVTQPADAVPQPRAQGRDDAQLTPS